MHRKPSMPCKGLGKYNGWGEFSRGEPAASIFDFAVRVFLKRMLAEDFERLVEQHGGLEWCLFMRLRVGAGFIIPPFLQPCPCPGAAGRQRKTGLNETR